MANEALARVREIALAMPEVSERSSHGAPSFCVQGKRPVCYFHDADFGDRGRVSLMCPAPAGVAEAMAATEPGRFYRPTPSASGVFGDWLGVWLDGQGSNRVDWAEVAAILRDAYVVVAPKRLVARLDEVG